MFCNFLFYDVIHFFWHCWSKVNLEFVGRRLRFVNRGEVVLVDFQGDEKGGQTSNGWNQ